MTSMKRINTFLLSLISIGALTLPLCVTRADEPVVQARPQDAVRQIDWVSLLPAPPVANSTEQERDLQAVVDIQKRYPPNSARSQLAVADAEASCFRFADVLGDKFNEASLPLTNAFLKYATQQSGRAANITKRYWKRPRPYIVSKQIVPLGDNNDARRRERSEAEQRDIDHTSFPSGHSTLGTMCALMLNRLVPEKKNELFARAEIYRESRMVLGVHFPTDLEAGRLLSTAVAAVISSTPEFQQQEAAARIELRAALGLPAELPMH